MTSSSPHAFPSISTTTTGGEDPNVVPTCWPRDDTGSSSNGNLSKFDLLRQYVENQQRQQQQKLLLEQRNLDGGSTESLPALRTVSPTSESAFRPPHRSKLRRSVSVQFAKGPPRVYRYPAADYDENNNNDPTKKASLALPWSANKIK